jgi:predicted O-methyltransferase YrrM
MRTFRHWTPRYIKDRLLSNIYRSAYPDRPWLTPAANAFLVSFLKETDIGLEFGSGISTLWFARRTRHLTSIEHNEAWYRKVQQKLKESHQQNVDYRFVPRDKEEVDGAQSAYVRQTERFDPGSLDIVLVDGIYRDFCALHVLNLIRPGGILVIDNVNKYLPSDSHAPNSRSFEDGPLGETWQLVHQALCNWRMFWTSSGVWDTAIFIKPCDES